MSVKTSEDEKTEVSKEETSPSSKGEEIVHATKSELVELFQKYQSEKSKSKMEGLLEEMLDTMRAAEGPVTSSRLMAVEDIDIKDYLEEPVTFFCYSFSHIAMDDKRWGHPVKTPYNRPIRFKPLYRYIKPGSSKYDQEIISMSVAIIRSKKEAEWIRKHTYFGIKYFETPKEAQTVDRVFSDNLVDTSNMLNSMSQFEVIQRAKQEKMEITPDIDDVKKRLTYHLAEKSMKEVKKPSFTPVDPTWDKTRTEEVLIDKPEEEAVPQQ